MSKNKFLISFCNNSKNISDNKNYIAELQVDVVKNMVSINELVLELPLNLNGNGITGMCRFKDSVVLLLQRMPSTLVFLDKNLKFEHSIALDGLKGVHTILEWQGEIYLSVTNQDRIVKLNQDHKLSEVWSNQTMTDNIHLNSIGFHQNELYASAFGEKAYKLWSSADSGYVFNVQTGERMIENIWHPHSIFSYADKLCCCNSSHQQIISEQGVLQEGLPGYSRGLYIDEKMVICGTSLGREVSHSTGVKISNKSDSGTIAGLCGISVYFKESNSKKFIDLTEHATEVFDVMRFD